MGRFTKEQIWADRLLVFRKTIGNFEITGYKSEKQVLPLFTNISMNFKYVLHV